MTTPYTKAPLSFDEQLAKLTDRGIEITDAEPARQQLALINYYRLSGYWYSFRVRDAHGQVTGTVRPGIRWDDIVALYEFDRRLRLLVLDAMERVEIAVRTQLTYHFAHRYGAFGHTDAANFHRGFSGRRHALWLEKVRDEAEKSRDAFILHFRNKYHGFPDVPIWMLTELMSFGTLSRLYSGMRNDDRKPIARHFNLHYKRLRDWLHTLTVIRNVCAHHSRLWNRQLSVRPDEQLEPEWQPPMTPRNDRIFYVLLMLRYLMKCDGNGDDWAANMDALLEPICENPEWREAMGIPENWKEHPLWMNT